MLTIRNRTAAAVTMALLAGLIGCSGDNVASQVAAMNTSNIQRLANMYAAFQNYKGGRGPKDAAEFKTFIKEFDPNKLSMMGIDPNKLDDVFTAERDGKPLLIRYQVGGGRGAVDAVVFEQEGKDGKKQVGFTGGKVEEVDNATYQQLRAGNRPGKDRPPTGKPAGAPAGP
jgi:hypothetical protein